MGFSISMSALIAKLWRVNRVFGAAASYRKVVEHGMRQPSN